MMEIILNVKTGLCLHKDCAMVTLTDTVMDRCNCSWQIDFMTVNVEDSQSNSLLSVYHCATSSAGSVLPVGQDISRDGDGEVWDIVCK
eukprot:g22415.t1